MPETAQLPEFGTEAASLPDFGSSDLPNFESHAKPLKGALEAWQQFSGSLAKGMAAVSEPELSEKRSQEIRDKTPWWSISEPETPKERVADQADRLRRIQQHGFFQAGDVAEKAVELSPE